MRNVVQSHQIGDAWPGDRQNGREAAGAEWPGVPVCHWRPWFPGDPASDAGLDMIERDVAGGPAAAARGAVCTTRRTGRAPWRRCSPAFRRRRTRPEVRAAAGRGRQAGARIPGGAPQPRRPGSRPGHGRRRCRNGSAHRRHRSRPDRAAAGSGSRSRSRRPVRPDPPEPARRAPDARITRRNSPAATRPHAAWCAAPISAGRLH